MEVSASKIGEIEETFGRGRRLLFVINQPNFFLSHRLLLAQAAKSVGFEVTVACPYESDAEVICSKGFSYRRIALDKWGMNPLRDLKSLFALVKLYRETKPDIVHHSTIKPVLYGSLAARIAGVKGIVNTVSGLGNFFISKGLAASARRALLSPIYNLGLKSSNSIVIVQNEEDQSLFQRKGIADDNLKLVRGSGVNLNTFRPSPLPVGVPVVLVPSRVLWDKGIREFVEAAITLRAEGVAARFIVAGRIVEGNPSGVPQSQIEKWEKDSPVEFLGEVPNMVELYSQATVVCLPSYREGLPKALLEAAACGRPIVATDTSGCREIVRDGYNGLLVPVRNAARLADAIRRLLDDRELSVTMGQNSRYLVENGDFSEESISRQVLDIYRELLSRSS